MCLIQEITYMQQKEKEEQERNIWKGWTEGMRKSRKLKSLKIPGDKEQESIVNVMA